MAAEGDNQLGMVWAVPPLQLKGPGFHCAQQRVIRGFQMAGDTIRRGRQQGRRLK